MPKKPINEIAERHAKEAIECLLEVIRDGENESARVNAANSILNRAFGQPTQTVAATVQDVSNIREISDDMLVAIVHMRPVPAPKSQRNGDAAKLIGSSKAGNGTH